MVRSGYSFVAVEVKVEYNKTLNVRSQGKQLVLFPERPDVSRDEVEGNIRTRGKTKLTGFPRDLTSSILLYSTFTSTPTKE